MINICVHVIALIIAFSTHIQLSGREIPLHYRPTSKKNIFHAIDIYVTQLIVVVHSLREMTGIIVAEERYFKFTSQLLEKYAAET